MELFSWLESAVIFLCLSCATLLSRSTARAVDSAQRVFRWALSAASSGRSPVGVYHKSANSGLGVVSLIGNGASGFFSSIEMEQALGDHLDSLRRILENRVTHQGWWLVIKWQASRSRRNGYRPPAVWS